MNIAVLIAGEFREFEIANKFWAFKSIPDIDYYFATWNKSVAVSEDPLIEPSIEDVTIDRIEKHITPFRVDIAECPEAHSSELMINRWKKAIQLLIDSDRSYERIILIRPDIALDYDVKEFEQFLNTMALNENRLCSLGSGTLALPIDIKETKQIADLFIMGTQPAILKLMELPDKVGDTTFPKTSAQINIPDIHAYLADQFAILYPEGVFNVPIPRQCIVRHNCRMLVEPTFNDCRLKAKDWWELKYKQFYSMLENPYNQVKMAIPDHVPPKLPIVPTNDAVYLWDRFGLNPWPECNLTKLTHSPDDGHIPPIPGMVTYGPNDIIYAFNEYGFRTSDNSLSTLETPPEYANFLVGGCSITEGIGIPEKHIWHSFLVEKFLPHSKRPISKINLAKGGRSIDAVVRYLYVAIEELDLRPDLVYLLLPPVQRKETIVHDTAVEPSTTNNWFIWDYLGGTTPDKAVKSIKKMHKHLVENTSYRQMYHDCYRNLLFVKALLEAKNIPWVFSFWADEFGIETVRESVSPAGPDTDCSVPKSLEPFYIPITMRYDPYIKDENNIKFKEQIARDYVHPGPNTHWDMTLQMYAGILKKKHTLKVLEKWGK